MSPAHREACLLAGLALFVTVAAAEARGVLAVECNDGQVSVHASAVPANRILGEIGRRCDVRIVLHESLDERVSLAIDGMTLPRAVKRILRGRSFMLRFAQPSLGAGNWLWVFADTPSGSRREEIVLPAAPVPVVDAQETIYLLGDEPNQRSMRLLREALADPDRSIREAAVETLGEIGGGEAALAVSAALNDPDVDIRESAVDALGSIGGDTATQLLHQMTADRHSLIREAAADNLEELTNAM